MTTNRRFTRRTALAGLILAAALATTACPGNLHHSYSGFQGAVEKGAPCAELFDQRERFTKATDLARVDADLARIGCATRDSVRTDG
jgi:hypothetical protein